MNHPYQNSLWGIQTREIGKDLGPVSHTRDPSTSKAAERSITDSGVRKTHNQRIHWLVCRYPGFTASEYWHMIEYPQREWPFEFKGFDLYEVRRRLSDMNEIHVKQGEARMGLLNKREVTWYPK